MDVLISAVARANSQAENEAAEAQRADDTQTKEDQQYDGEAQMGETDSDARQSARNFLQSMGNLRTSQALGESMEAYMRRWGKEPALSATQATATLTPLEQRAHQHTPPTKPHGAAGP